jgi:hypothetical protein
MSGHRASDCVANQNVEPLSQIASSEYSLNSCNSSDSLNSFHGPE